MNVLSKLSELKLKLADLFVQREAEITAVLAGLLSGEPVILVGEAGTAKTILIEKMAELIDARYFYYLLTRFTEPDEILGPLDINALREGRYVRRTEGRLPEAEIVFLDEIFKASSAIRNILLDIILNRRFRNNGDYTKLPMLTMYTASNEVSSDVEDMAFYDRLTVRCFVKSVSEDAWSELIERGVTLEDLKLEPVIDVEEIRQIHSVVMDRFRKMPESNLIQVYLDALASLKQKGVRISDRRKIKLLKVASAISVIYGENEVSADSLAEALKFVAVHDEDDVRKVDQVIFELGLSSYYKHIQKIQTVNSELQNAIKLSRSGGVDELKMLSTICNRANEMLEELPQNPRLMPYIRQLRGSIFKARDILERKKAEIFGL